ncbi:MAG: hypothetical protein C0498_04555 [Anaerolinea sp.]|nr:hypothetical protein [Anaerolinea sp.]
MSDAIAVLLQVVIPVVVLVALIVPARSRRWAADHLTSTAARRFGIVGGVLGFAVAAFWAGRFLGLW